MQPIANPVRSELKTIVRTKISRYTLPDKQIAQPLQNILCGVPRYDPCDDLSATTRQHRMCSSVSVVVPFVVRPCVKSWRVPISWRACRFPCNRTWFVMAQVINLPTTDMTRERFNSIWVTRIFSTRFAIQNYLRIEFVNSGVINE